MIRLADAERVLVGRSGFFAVAAGVAPQAPRPFFTCAGHVDGLWEVRWQRNFDGQLFVNDKPARLGNVLLDGDVLAHRPTGFRARFRAKPFAALVPLDDDALTFANDSWRIVHDSFGRPHAVRRSDGCVFRLRALSEDGLLQVASRGFVKLDEIVEETARQQAQLDMEIALHIVRNVGAGGLMRHSGSVEITIDGRVIEADDETPRFVGDDPDAERLPVALLRALGWHGAPRGDRGEAQLFAALSIPVHRDMSVDLFMQAVDAFDAAVSSLRDPVNATSLTAGCVRALFPERARGEDALREELGLSEHR